MKTTLRRQGRGQTLIEYVLIISMVSVVMIGALTMFGQSLQDKSNETVTALNAVTEN